LVGVAVKVTDVPAQIAPEGTAVTLTDGVTIGFTVIVIPEDIALAGVAHGELDVMIAVTMSPFANADEE
jgi:hypothetical protein